MRTVVPSALDGRRPEAIRMTVTSVVSKMGISSSSTGPAMTGSTSEVHVALPLAPSA